MDIVKDLLAGNAAFVTDKWDPQEAAMPGRPARQLAVLACMDTRHSIERVLGLQHGDAKVIRNAGAIVDDGALRSLIVGVHLLGVKHIVVMGHTKCGMTSVGQGDFTIAHSIADSTDIGLHEVMLPKFQNWLGGFPDAEAQVKRSVDLLRSHPYFPDEVTVDGLIYDNDSGKVHRVTGAAP